MVRTWRQISSKIGCLGAGARRLGPWPVRLKAPIVRPQGAGWRGRWKERPLKTVLDRAAGPIIKKLGISGPMKAVAETAGKVAAKNIFADYIVPFAADYADSLKQPRPNRASLPRSTNTGPRGRVQAARYTGRPGSAPLASLQLQGPAPPPTTPLARLVYRDANQRSTVPAKSPRGDRR